MFDPVERDIADHAVVCGAIDEWQTIVDSKAGSLLAEIMDSIPEWAVDLIEVNEDKIRKLAEEKLITELEEEKTQQMIADWEDRHYYLYEY